MKFLKWLYLDVWLVMNFYFGVVYNQVSQFKFLAEIMVLVGVGYFYLFGGRLTHKQLLLTFAALFVLGIGAGKLLVILGVPQKGNKLGNSINPELTEILERVKKIEEKL